MKETDQKVTFKNVPGVKITVVIVGLFVRKIYQEKPKCTDPTFTVYTPPPPCSYGAKIKIVTCLIFKPIKLAVHKCIAKARKEGEGLRGL